MRKQALQRRTATATSSSLKRLSGMKKRTRQSRTREISKEFLESMASGTSRLITKRRLRPMARAATTPSELRRLSRTSFGRSLHRAAKRHFGITMSPSELQRATSSILKRLSRK